MVIIIHLKPSGIVYELGFGDDSSEHYDIEMSSTPDETIRLGLNKEAEK